MLQIEVDLYSGRPNPRLEVEEARASGILAGAEPGRDLIPVEQTSSTLGYRGLILRSRGEPLMEKAAGSRARLATSTFGDAAIGRELALRLIDAAEPVRDREGPELLLEAAEVREQKRFLMEQIAGEVPLTSHPLTEKMEQGLFQAPHVLVPCQSETLRYDPTFWNDPLHVRRNNCYAFATNRRTDTFPQPGRASGSILRSLDCPEVGRASLADGLRWDGNCFGDEEQPRLYVALVIWPGQDYHWYRLQEGGNWAHKPGGTPATDLDSSGARIADPRTCDRGPYSQFCGYMLSPKSVRVA